LFPLDAFNVSIVHRRDFICVGQQQKFRYLVDLKDPLKPPSVGGMDTPQFNGETKKQTFFFASGWNPPEQSGLSSFRWMCKKGVVAINPQLNTSKLVIDFDYPDNLKVFPSLSISQNGVTLSVVNLTAGPQTVAVFLIPDEVNKTRLLTLEVSALFDAPGDPRELGLKVHNVRCE
jgi:phenylacetate-CoA ligase